MWLSGRTSWPTLQAGEVCLGVSLKMAFNEGGLQWVGGAVRLSLVCPAVAGATSSDEGRRG
jgi:hypothetical protein